MNHKKSSARQVRGSAARTISRRQAVGGGLAAAAGVAGVPMVLPSRVVGAAAPSKRVTLGFIGVGSHGHGYNLNNFLQHGDAQAVAVCDVFKSRAAKAKATVDKKYGNRDCRTYQDFRDVLARQDIDAVVISTPDHWHVPISLMALDAGKDVFCEKPTLTIAEGRTLVDTVAKHRAVFQVGLEDRSVIHYHKMSEIVRSGGIGKLHTIRVKLPGGTDFPQEKPVPVPADLDWNMWLGPAPVSPYTPSRTGPQQWRNIRDYAGGKLADWGAHLLDTAQVGNFAEASGPVEVDGEGYVPENSMTTMPIRYNIKYRYANDVVMHVESGSVAIRFEGDAGWVGNVGWRGRLQASSKDILLKKYSPQDSRIWPRPPGEHRNFLDCVKSRQPTTYTAEADQRLSTVMHIGNIAIELGRKLRWDPSTESFVNDNAANALRSRTAREDWKT